MSLRSFLYALARLLGRRERRSAGDRGEAHRPPGGGKGDGKGAVAVVEVGAAFVLVGVVGG
ncbi:hypothetical protein caldi_34320 [Caldinitratiruptor microaerophilus]|uniref:Uncharacterized protein n=1 Tax=Caldinitratiruptor microaerophilus TaxID=671077 RepID=A0AA35CNB1_9FIRM|nr:hypothetical protein caldi_34320 [Caldinitratiruptor microaerophilus]